MKKIKSLAVAAVGAVSMMAMNAHAAIDITAATTGVTDAQAALVSLLGVFLGLSTTILGLTMVYKYIARKAGA